MDIRRMAYIPAIGTASPMFPGDTWEQESFNYGYTQNPAGTPLVYLQSTEPPLSFDTDTPPGFGGTYEIVAVVSPGGLFVYSPSLLYVPDDWAWVIKWGALADLMSKESNAKDSERAEYCNKRYQLGMKLLAQAPALLAMRIGNVPLLIDSVRDLDLYNPGWEGLTPATPGTAVHIGLNLVGFAAPPDDNPIGGGNNYSCTATVVRNAPIPASTSAYLQVAREDLDVIIDYAQHLAAFKMGGQEFLAAMPLLERFLTAAMIRNSKLKEMGEFTQYLLGLSQRQEQMAPRMADET
jgi:hypothetical protein